MTDTLRNKMGTRVIEVASECEEARDRAETIFAVQKALTDSLVTLSEASQEDKIIMNKMVDLFKAVVDGRATENIVPPEFDRQRGNMAYSI